MNCDNIESLILSNKHHSLKKYFVNEDNYQEFLHVMRWISNESNIQNSQREYFYNYEPNVALFHLTGNNLPSSPHGFDLFIRYERLDDFFNTPVVTEISVHIIR